MPEVQIFLCYARDDQPTVKKIHQRVFEQGFSPWMDTENLLGGEDWKESITQAIQHSDFFLACLSTNSVTKTGFLQKEIKLALEIWEEKPESDIFLIPLRLEKCDIPRTLSRFQCIDVFEANWETRLLKSIQTGISRKSKLQRSDLPMATTELHLPDNEGHLTRDKPIFEAWIPLFEQYKFENYFDNIEDSLIKQFNWKPDKVHATLFAFREVVDNAFEHGCKGKGELVVSMILKLEANGERLIFRVKSPGSGFNFQFSCRARERVIVCNPYL
jgi:hypothetical protein